MKTKWCFSTVRLVIFYISNVSSGVILAYIIRGLREGQTSFHDPLLLLALVALILLPLSMTREAGSE